LLLLLALTLESPNVSNDNNKISIKPLPNAYSTFNKVIKEKGLMNKKKERKLPSKPDQKQNVAYFNPLKPNNLTLIKFMVVE
jgi:hypothetical protein